ncbi:MAG: gamma-glutamyl-gamma-aminobutyrate hydrolase family protein [Firmicutes bacterium]|jgi:putative glutamine amidotransferase|nr:gamma-glutamyl-gamma-aminobutyrate hydrolase family protein [Bacillota bacterium]
MAVLVGITCNRVGFENRLSLAYVHAILQAGGVPFLLPICRSEHVLRRQVARLDALLLSGGGDPDASLYGEEAHPGQGIVQPDRDEMELFLVHHAFNCGLPVLGICRGAQVMAVAAGGKLLQDLRGVERVQHNQRAPRSHPIHSVLVRKNTLLYRITGRRKLRVNSMHHQAVRLPGQLTVAAVAADGVIEAVELPGHPFALGVQWHPEWLVRTTVHALPLFKAFCAAAGKCRKKN